MISTIIKHFSTLFILLSAALLLASFAGELSYHYGIEAGLSAVALFLTSEIFVKNDHYSLLHDESPNRRFNHHWKGAASENTVPAMGNMVFEADQPFVLLIGFRVVIPALKVNWFHCYGSAKSDNDNRIVVRTWLGKGPCEFQYQTNIDASTISVTRDPAAQKLTPHVINEPHWYQKGPFYIFG